MIKKLYTTKEKIESTEVFLKFKKENPENYLTSAFFISPFSKLEYSWQLDYFSPKNHTISSFKFENNDLKIIKNQNIFQKNKNQLNELNLEDIKFSKIKEKIEELKNEKSASESFNKIIVLLQNIENQTIWNITLLTNSFKVWNIKINAENGQILSEKLENVLSFKAKPQ